MKLLDKKWKWAVAGILLLVIVIVIYGLYVYFFWTCCPEPIGEELPRLRAACQSEGGFFVEELEICQLPAGDAGKICENSSECEGFCEADLSADEIIKIAGGNRVEKSGTCGQWKNFFTGCFYVVENGKAEKVCAD